MKNQDATSRTQLFILCPRPIEPLLFDGRFE